jgi:hypothetical protein
MQCAHLFSSSSACLLLCAVAHLLPLFREPEGVPLDQDWPESDDEQPPAAGGGSSSLGSASCKDPLGLLTWPLDSKGRSAAAILAGNGSSGLMLSGMGASAAGSGSNGAATSAGQGSWVS